MLITRRSLLAAILPAASSRALSIDKAIWEKDPRSDTPLFRFVADGKTGYIDRSGKIVIPAQFRENGNMSFDDFFEGVAVVNGIERIPIDATGTRLDFSGYRIAGNYSGGLIPVRVLESGKTIFLNKSRKQAFAASYEGASSFSEGLAAVQIGQRYGYIDRAGSVVIEPRYWYASDFSDGVALAAAEGPCQWPDWIPNYGTRPEKTVCRLALIDRKGSPLSDRTFEAVSDFKEGLAKAREGRWWGFLGKSGSFSIPPSHYFVDSFSEGLAAFEVREGLQWGYLDKQGAIVIPPSFDSAAPFSEGAAVAGKRMGPSWFIDKSGNRLFGREFKAAGSFHLGLAHVDDGEQLHWIDRTGRAVFSYPRPER